MEISNYYPDHKWGTAVGASRGSQHRPGAPPYDDDDDNDEKVAEDTSGHRNYLMKGSIQ